jgi:XrtJ-associated TM-motif-TM protein
MNKPINYAALLSLFLFVALPLHGSGIGGCVDSPENPTAILGLAAAAGIFAVSSRRKIVLLWRENKQWKR